MNIVVFNHSITCEFFLLQIFSCLKLRFHKNLNNKTKIRKLQNRFWLFLIIFDYFWLFLIIVDYFWLFLIIFDYFWLFFWLLLIIFCHFFKYFPRNGNVSKKFRKCMKFHHFRQIFIKFCFWLFLIIFWPNQRAS